MTDTSETFLTEDDRKTLIKLYVLYFFGFLTVVTGIIALVKINRRMKDGPVQGAMLGHFTYMIRTFWVVALLGGVPFVLMFMVGGGLGFLLNLLLLVALVWGLLRCAKGAILATNGRPIPDPQTWTFPKA